MTPEPAPLPAAVDTVDTPSFVVQSSIRIRPLTHRPLLLRTCTLLSHIVLTLVWITILFLSRRITSPLNGSAFLLDGFVSGYISSALKSFAQLQVTALDEIMPYLCMASNSADDTKASCTVMADYFPYDYPYPRLRILLNGHIVLFFVEWATFLGTLVLVQFSANILHPVYDNDSGDFLGWLPNRTIILIVIACHIILLLVTLFLVVWLNKTTTGLLPAAQPGSLTTMIGMLYGGIVSGNGVHEDFLGLDGEDRRWVIRKHLEGKTYRLGYWGKDGRQYYGIGRGDTGKEEQDGTRAFEHNSSSRRPKFSYIPWFLRPLAMSIAVSILTAFLAIAITLIRGTNVLRDGFSPHGSTFVSPTLLMSPAGFLWSFIPSFVADLYRLLFKNIDAFYKFTQPYVDLVDPTLSSEQTVRALALSYPSELPVVITYRALQHRHWKVAFSSVVSLAASFIPALAANMFFPDFNRRGEPRIFIYQQPFFLVITSVFFLSISLLVLIPDVTRSLPHDLETLAERFSFLCGSSLLSDRRFAFDEDELLEPQTIHRPSGGWSLAAVKDRRAQLVADVKGWWNELSHEERVRRRLVDGFHVGFGEGRKGHVAVIDRREEVILPYATEQLRSYFWQRLKECVI